MHGTEKKVDPGAVDPRQLIVDCAGLDAAAVEKLGRKIYAERFLSDARKGQHATHDGDRVTFFAGDFDHAFFRSPEKQVIDSRRVERIEWVLPLMQGLVCNAECWLIDDHGVLKRLYVCFGLGYVVWLKENLNGGWKFITAYPAFRAQIRKYVAGATRIAVFKK
jgi:hypothetical protein